MTTIIAGLLVGIAFQKCKLDRFVDKKSLGHFATVCLDFLVASTIASVDLQIFTSYGQLILGTSVTIIIMNAIVIFGLSKLWKKKCWFENAIGVFGVGTGVSATGLFLLRTADPDNNTGVMKDYLTGVALLAASTQFVFLNFVPMWISSYGDKILKFSALALIMFVVLGSLIAKKAEK